MIQKKFQMEVWTKDFDNQKVYCETSIFDDLGTACGF